MTAAFMQYLDDRVAAFREVAADIVEAGGFTAGAAAELANPDVVRGQLLALKELRRIDLAAIHDFYGKEPPDSQDQQAEHEPAPRGDTGYDR